ncbi:MAG: hypothetical protein WD491_04010 [Balneolales bacterium]
MPEILGVDSAYYTTGSLLATILQKRFCPIQVLNPLVILTRIPDWQPEYRDILVAFGCVWS